MTKYVIQTESLTKRYGDITALDTIDINVHKGEIYGFLGPNGAGKTTLINILLGLLKPTEGQVKLFDTPVERRDPEMFLRIGVVGEEQHFYENMTASEYLSLFSELLAVNKGQETVQKQLEAFDLWEWRDRAIKTFSHGMRQKLALARALIHDPEVLILDEPVTGLDPHGIKKVREMLFERKEQDKTIFISSHVLSEVEQLADRVGILHKGRLLAEGSVSDLGVRLQKRTIVEIELDPKPAQVVEILNNLPYVVNARENNHLIIVETESSRDHRKEISRTITNHGGLIIGMNIKRPSLEETFVTLTDKNLAMVTNMVGS
jgi:ABC-type multidrug transport system ATPase subunit